MLQRYRQQAIYGLFMDKSLWEAQRVPTQALKSATMMAETEAHMQTQHRNRTGAPDLNVAHPEQPETSDHRP